MKKAYFILYFFAFLTIFAFSSYSNEINTLDVVEKVEKNLIYSKEVLKQDKSNDIVIKKGGWTQEDTKDIEKFIVSDYFKENFFKYFNVA